MNNVASIARERADLPSVVVPEDATVRKFLEPFKRYLDLPGVKEVCVNRPLEVAVEFADRWEFIDEPQATLAHCMSLANAVATLTMQYTNGSSPLLSCTLPDGERIQICLPGATLPGIVGIAIRRPTQRILRLEDFQASGLFERIRPAARELNAHQQELMKLKEDGDYLSFMRRAVQFRQTILVAGRTGSGKTTFMKALAEEIGRLERLVVIEDSLEMVLPNHRNKLNLLFSKGGQGTSKLAARQLLEACLRLRPDRILLAEVRGEEAYSFLRMAASGHPGSLTSLHAGSAELAFEQLALMVRESGAGGGLTMTEIRQLARDVIDVVVHMDDDQGRHITGIHFDPMARLTNRT